MSKETIDLVLGKSYVIKTNNGATFVAKYNNNNMFITSEASGLERIVSMEVITNIREIQQIKSI